MFQTVATIFKTEDLRNRILFTLAMLAIYRLGIFIPAPGVDRNALSDFFADTQGTLLSLYNMFSGGALEQFSVFVLGIMPYISASIIMQFGQVMIPRFERLKSEGQAGRKKINQYTRYITVLIAIIQSTAISFGLEQMKTMGGQPVVLEDGWSFRLMTIITMTAGSCFVMWLGEQITERGIGQGASLIITAGIIAAIPSGARNLYQSMELGQVNLLTITLLFGFMVIVIGAIVFIERGQYRVPILYAKRVVGQQSYGGQQTHLPLKVNVAGVIPPIFASSLMVFPATIGSIAGSNPVFEGLAAAFVPGTWTYLVTFVILIVVFTFFYTAITFNPTDIADNLQRQNAYVPGYRPGLETIEHLSTILTRLTAGGAIYLSFICVMPTILADNFGVPFGFGGTGLLIIVSVCMQTVSQVESYMLNDVVGTQSNPQVASKGRRKKFQGRRNN
ncbi:MAG: preprotein translocase subunit SecY [Myxococcota bacterium]|nr:preprotein translocase subunit SecY [Myxococcota bacterium]